MAASPGCCARAASPRCCAPTNAALLLPLQLLQHHAAYPPTPRLLPALQEGQPNRFCYGNQRALDLFECT